MARVATSLGISRIGVVDGEARADRAAGGVDAGRATSVRGSSAEQRISNWAQIRARGDLVDLGAQQDDALGQQLGGQVVVEPGRGGVALLGAGSVAGTGPAVSGDIGAPSSSYAAEVPLSPLSAARGP
ncbi:hypothetical protein SFUMM280S_00603 [Streptomyces fumanus]